MGRCEERPSLSAATFVAALSLVSALAAGCSANQSDRSQIDRAMCVARGEVCTNLDYWMPVLFMRLRSGSIWYEPGFGEGFDQWPALLTAIRKKKFVPILGPDLGEDLFGPSAELAAELNRVGLKSGTGKCFNVASIQWIRYAYRIDRPQLLAPGELSVKQVAARLGIAAAALYGWISQGQITVRRAEHGRLWVPFTQEVEQTLRQRIANSNRIRLRTQNVIVGDAV